ncbi:MAG: ornithine aminomutase subunit alpha [Eubacteriales bacterium]|nr:ornithine aminomutase subunit alpha [Eubacteriales bacterium]
MKRADDFDTRREHLQGLSDRALHERFWSLAERLTNPLLEMGRFYTSPSIERSVLLRMGFSSIEAKALVDACLEKGLLGHGAGHVVYKAGQQSGKSVREAGLALIRGEGWEGLDSSFSKEDA